VARAHTAGEEKHGTWRPRWLRLLVFSSFCSGILAAGKKGIPICEIFLTTHKKKISHHHHIRWV
jgi:hypothetical protein